MSTKDQPLVIGGIPRVDLLPPSIREARRTRSLARALVGAVVVVAFVAAAGIGLSVVRAVNSQTELERERDRTNDLLSAQLEFTDVRTTAQQVAEARIAQQLATATEVDWAALLDELAGTLPPGLMLTSVLVDSPSPTDVAPLAGAALQTEWATTLSLGAKSVTVPDVETWLNSLEELNGFAGVAPPVTVSEKEGDLYEVSVDVHFSDDLYTHRFEVGAEGR